MTSTAQPPYLIEVRDSNRQRIGQIDQLISLEMLPKFAQVGSWVLSIPEDSAQAALLVPNKTRIAIYQEGQTQAVFSGPVWQRKTIWGESDAGIGTLEVSGPDDLWWLAKRLAYQVPGSVASSQGGSAQNTRGPDDAETVIREFVDVNAGPGALTAREVAGLVLDTNGSRGSTVTGVARMSNLLELLRQLAIAGGVGFQIAQDGTDLLFSVYEPADLTATARFARDLGNLRSMIYTETGPNVNAILVGGPGDGTARVFAEYLDATAITAWGRVEEFVDASGAALTAERDQVGLQELVENGQNTQLQIETEDTDDLRYGIDYRLGDTVTVEPRPGVVIQDVVRELRIVWSAQEGWSQTASVGSFNATGDPKIVEALRKAWKRLRQLERWR